MADVFGRGAEAQRVELARSEQTAHERSTAILVLKRIFIFFVAAFLAFLGLLFAGRFVAQRRTTERIRIPATGGIHRVEKVRLGGYEQWIELRGRDATKPLLLFLHGGPGFPQTPFAHLNAELERDFIVVQWDQRAAGRSYSWSVPEGSMRVEQFVSDGRELLELLHARFGARSCYVVAHSWGSLFGAKLVAAHPELVTAYVGIGQAVDLSETAQVQYDFALDAARRADNPEAVSELEKIGRPPHSFEHHEPMNRWVNFYSEREHTSPSALWMTRLALQSPAYSWLDLLKIPLGFRYSFARLWKEIFFETSLFREAPRLEVPAYFFLGRHDMVVTSAVAQRYFEKLEAPRGKQLIWFENSGHWPQFEEPEKYRAALRRVLDETEPRTHE